MNTKKTKKKKIMILINQLTYNKKGEQKMKYEKMSLKNILKAAQDASNGAGGELRTTDLVWLALVYLFDAAIVAGIIWFVYEMVKIGEMLKLSK